MAAHRARRLSDAPAPAGDRRHGFRRRSDATVRRTSHAAVALLGFVGGLAAGALVWSQQVHQHRRGLFSRSPLRRLAALGYLGGQPSVDAARLVRDYMEWERRPALRRRGQQVLRQIERALDASSLG